MGAVISDIDHLMCRVDDPQTAGEAFARLGFQVMPLSPLAGGLGNRCILLKPLGDLACNYIDLIGVLDAGRCPPFMSRTRAPPERVATIVGSCADARSSHARLDEAGHRGIPPMDIERDWR